jgi:hypothetical protein
MEGIERPPKTKTRSEHFLEPGGKGLLLLMEERIDQQ